MAEDPRGSFRKHANYLRVCDAGLVTQHKVPEEPLPCDGLRLGCDRI
jgi:hypothetical protein